MVKMAVTKGFVPVLGVLWCSYVPGTRCSDKSPVRSAMPFEAVEPYARYIAERFSQFDPIFFISGDTQFGSPDEETYFMAAPKAVKSVCPDALLTMHLTPNGDLPPKFQNVIDFYMYQSGHHAELKIDPTYWQRSFVTMMYPIRSSTVNLAMKDMVE